MFAPKIVKAPTQANGGSSSSGAWNLRPIVHDVAREPGQPLDSRVRALLEPRFAHDFSRVRIHADARAAEAAHALRAHAYTQGEHIVFAKDRYVPGTTQGLRLLGHELAHVVQQSAGWVEASGARTSVVTNSTFEREADLAGDRVARAQRVEGLRSAPPGTAAQRHAPRGPIQRDADTSKQPESSATLRPASDAVAGIHIEFSAPPLPHVEATLDRFNFKRGPYLFAANLRGINTGTPTVVYYVAYRTDARRNEYIIGPDSLDLFLGKLDDFKTIGDTAYADPGVIDYIVGFGDSVWDQQGDIVTQYMQWLGLHDMAALHAEMVKRGKEIRDEQRTRQQQQAKGTMAAKVLPLINAAMMAAAGVRMLAGPRGAPTPGGGAKPPVAAQPGGEPPATTRPATGSLAAKPAQTETAPKAPPTETPTVQGDAPTSGPDLFKKTAQAPGGQAEKIKFFDENAAILKQRTGWAANRAGQASDGSVVYHGEAQQKALVITGDGRVFTGTWGENVKLQRGGPSGLQLVCDWTIPGWKQW
jgi:hypothetical protein